MKEDEKMINEKFTTKKKSLRDRLVGALGGGGGGLALSSLIRYLLWPQRWSLNLLIIFEAIGIFLFSLSIIIYKKGI